MRPIIIRGQLAACRKALAAGRSMFSHRQLVDCWDGATPLNDAQIALTDRPIYWMGSALVLSAEDVTFMAEPGGSAFTPSRQVRAAAERLLFGLVPMYPLDRAAKLLALANTLRGEGR